MSTTLEWDKLDERFFELGVDRGVFYPYDQSTATYKTGIVWNGLINVTEKPTGGEDNKQYADNLAYANIRSEIEFEASIEAFTYPTEMALCDGSAQPEKGVFVGQQRRKPFGFGYRTKVGTSNDNLEFAYKLHLVYAATPEPSEKSRDTINESPEASTFTWDVKAEKQAVTGLLPAAHISIDSRDVDPVKLAAFEAIIWGSSTEPARLPDMDEVIAHFAEDEG